MLVNSLAIVLLALLSESLSPPSTRIPSPLSPSPFLTRTISSSEGEVGTSSLELRER